MAVAEKQTMEEIPTPAPTPASTGAQDAEQTAPTLEGRVDAIDQNRLYGWVWSPQSPDARIEVVVRLNGHALLRETAENERVDLRRNGIGDGKHAFEVELPDAAVASVESLTVCAVMPGTKEEITLRIPSQSEQEAHTALNAPLGKILDRLDRLLAAQHILQNGQREAAKRLVSASKRMDELASADDGIEAGVKLVRNGQEELSSRVDELEVFLVRFDKSLGGFDERLSALTARHTNDLKTPLLILSCLIGVTTGLAIGAFVW
ncbi:hypothetical protein IT893_00115 [Thalassospira sp. A40-3]|uniref:hypothetical protein n=1 Tax=Thalassospira sp. A40-3 TaxID=2785908 RepID=UPI0018CFAAA4|nr:hypothetical protein [Thalassospira sp. A40-3]QPO11979.1 hypothetical protein IT893_00115 [Thalassospira sp. A40-3]